MSMFTSAFSDTIQSIFGSESPGTISFRARHLEPAFSPYFITKGTPNKRVAIPDVTDENNLDFQLVRAPYLTLDEAQAPRQFSATSYFCFNWPVWLREFTSGTCTYLPSLPLMEYLRPVIVRFYPTLNNLLYRYVVQVSAQYHSEIDNPAEVFALRPDAAPLSPYESCLLRYYLYKASKDLRLLGALNTYFDELLQLRRHRLSLRDTLTVLKMPFKQDILNTARGVAVYPTARVMDALLTFKEVIDHRATDAAKMCPYPPTGSLLSELVQLMGLCPDNNTLWMQEFLPSIVSESEGITNSTTARLAAQYCGVVVSHKQDLMLINPSYLVLGRGYSESVYQYLGMNKASNLEQVYSLSLINNILYKAEVCKLGRRISERLCKYPSRFVTNRDNIDVVGGVVRGWNIWDSGDFENVSCVEITRTLNQYKRSKSQCNLPEKKLLQKVTAKVACIMPFTYQGILGDITFKLCTYKRNVYCIATTLLEDADVITKSTFFQGLWTYAESTNTLLIKLPALKQLVELGMLNISDTMNFFRWMDSLPSSAGFLRSYYRRYTATQRLSMASDSLRWTTQEDQAICELLRPRMTKHQKENLLKQLKPMRNFKQVLKRGQILRTRLIAEGVTDATKIPRASYSAALDKALRKNRRQRKKLNKPNASNTTVTQEPMGGITNK
jgi:hypothetical protein